MQLQHLTLEQTTSQASVRQRELEVGDLVLRAVHAGDAFLVRRACAGVAALDTSPVRRSLKRVAEGLQEADVAGIAAGLLGYGAALERHGVYAAAEAAYRTVMDVRPDEACVTLHTARAARKAGRREEALALYRRASEQAGGQRHMALLVRIGEALISESPLQALDAVVRNARAAGDHDALAIAREERARLRPARAGGGAVRDLLAAAGRYRDPIDQVRVLHRLAELLSARGDLPAAREALLAALDITSESKRGHTVQRLRTVARAMGDELELRRSRGQGEGKLVTLAPVPTRRGPGGRSLAARLQRFRSLLS